AGAQVSFTATASNFPTVWNWDFGGGATPNTATGAAPQVTLGAAGVYNGTVTATNAAGSSTPFPFTYTVATQPTWVAHTLDGPRPFNVVSGLLAGKPAFAYSQINGNSSCTLYYATTPVPTAASHWRSSPMPTTGQGYPQSLVEVHGRAALTWFSIQNLDYLVEILQARVTEPASTADWRFLVLDTVVPSNASSCVADYNGRMAVLYNNAVALRAALATVDAPGTIGEWSIHTAVGNVAPHGLPSLQVINGRLVASFQVVSPNSTDNVRYLRATTATPTGTDSWTHHSIGYCNTATGSHLFLAGGVPTVAFVKNASHTAEGETPGIWVARSAVLEPSVTADWTQHQVTTSPVALPDEWDADLHGGRLALAYLTAESPTLYAVRALAAAPASTADYRAQALDGPDAALTSTALFPGGDRATVLRYRYNTQLTEVLAANLPW
ncbi:MAG TPA: PKD domain-containing protein, partial [bacterium]|nr:PKD domain-containing protein [bacterium]